MVCWSVGAHQSAAVQAKHYLQVLQGHVMNDLVVGALHKR